MTCYFQWNLSQIIVVVNCHFGKQSGNKREIWWATRITIIMAYTILSSELRCIFHLSQTIIGSISKHYCLLNYIELITKGFKMLSFAIIAKVHFTGKSVLMWRTIKFHFYFSSVIMISKVTLWYKTIIASYNQITTRNRLLLQSAFSTAIYRIAKFTALIWIWLLGLLKHQCQLSVITIMP